MPAGGDIINNLTAISNQWTVVAIFWHVYFGMLAVQLLLAYRPRKRFFTLLVAAPLVSVGVLAWDSGNPFNAATFAALVILLLVTAFRLPSERITIASPLWVVFGIVMFAFGWLYPHFLVSESPLRYLYAAPTGLVPCPTLSIVIGLALIFRGLDSLAWSAPLGMAGAFYGLFGAVHLGIPIDAVLIFGSVCLLVQCAVRTDEPADRPEFR